MRKKTKPHSQAATVLEDAQLDTLDSSAQTSQPQAVPEEFAMDVDELGFTELDIITLGFFNGPQADSNFPEEEDEDFEWHSWG